MIQSVVAFIADHTRDLFVADCLLLTLVGMLLIAFSSRVAKRKVRLAGASKSPAEQRRIYSFYFWLGLGVGLALIVKGAWGLLVICRGN
jgi:hypothetical protein